MSWFRKRKHQFRGVLAFLHPQFLHYSQLAAVLAAHLSPSDNAGQLSATPALLLREPRAIALRLRAGSFG